MSRDTNGRKAFFVTAVDVDVDPEVLCGDS
jgi:hypothetical protein